MRSRLAMIFGAVATAALAAAWATTRLTDSALVFVLVAVVGVGVAGAVGHRVAGRLSDSYHDLVRRDQAVAVRASHELRTPITALRLSLEDLTLWKHVPADATEELRRAIAELDRLSDAVTRLLDERHEARPTEEVDLAAAAAAVVERWRPQVAPPHRIVLDATVPVRAHLPTPVVHQVLDAMLGHATTRSSAGVSVDVARLGGTIRMRVAYDDPRRLATGFIHATAPACEVDGDTALAAAGALAESMGGFLAVEDAATTCLVLIVPAA